MKRTTAYGLLAILTLLAPAGARADDSECYVTFAVEQSGEIGHLLFEASYAHPEIAVGVRGNSGPACFAETWAHEDAYRTVVAGTEILSISMFSMHGFDTPTTMVGCDFTSEVPPTAEDFSITVLSAARQSTAPILPLPTVSVADIACFSTPHSNDDATTTTTTTTTSTSTTTTTTLPSPAGVCGDGNVDSSVEQCDNGPDDYRSGDACGDDCSFVSCGDADGSGSIGASDALITLQSAVGMTTCAPCVCDVDASSGLASASDALQLLSNAVGGPVELVCVPCD